MKNDVILINPPNGGSIMALPLGTLLLHDICREAGFMTGIMDLQAKILRHEIPGDAAFFEALAELISATEATVFCISILNTAYPWTRRLVKVLRRIHPHSTIIVGGPHVTLLKQLILEENPTIDCAVVYEGERVIIPLIAHFTMGRPASELSVRNTYIRTEKNRIRFYGEEPLITDLDELPLIDVSGYPDVNTPNLEVGRGCPFSCYFCSTNVIWKKKPRFKGADRIVQEGFRLISCLDKTDKIVILEHDNFLSQTNILSELSDAFSRHGVKFRWGCSARVDSLSADTIKNLKQAGCCYLFCGIETGSERIQQICGKRLDLQTALESIKLACEEGIAVECSFIIGFPDETEEEALSTLSLATQIAWAGGLVSLTVMNPEPQSPLGLRTIAEDCILLTENSYYKNLQQANLLGEISSPHANSHIYTIRNPHFDIMSLWAMANFYGFVLRYFPVSTFLAFAHLPCPVNAFLQSYNELFRNDVTPSAARAHEILTRIFERSPPREMWSRDVALFEYLRAMKVLNEPADVERYEFEYDIRSVYRTLKNTIRRGSVFAIPKRRRVSVSGEGD